MGFLIINIQNMDYSGFISKGSRMRSFFDMIDIVRVIGIERCVNEWSDRIDSWGWNRQELIDLISEFK